MKENPIIAKQYEKLGICREVYTFGRKIEEKLKDRFEKFDQVAELNQMRVLAAMQKHKVSAECFNATNGYGYNDLGRDTPPDYLRHPRPGPGPYVQLTSRRRALIPGGKTL